MSRRTYIDMGRNAPRYVVHPLEPFQDNAAEMQRVMDSWTDREQLDRAFQRVNDRLNRELLDAFALPSEALAPSEPLTHARLREAAEILQRPYQPPRTIVIQPPPPGEAWPSIFEFPEHYRVVASEHVPEGQAFIFSEPADPLSWTFGEIGPDEVAAATAAEIDAQPVETAERPAKSYDEWHAECVGLLEEAEASHR